MSQYSRKYDGPPIRELRRVDQDPIKVAPHKKPKEWTLTVEWSDTTTWRRTRKFTSRAARDEAKRRIERHFREKAEEAKKPQVHRRSYYWGPKSPFAEFSDEKISAIKTEPTYTEGYGDASEVSARE